MHNLIWNILNCIFSQFELRDNIFALSTDENVKSVTTSPSLPYAVMKALHSLRNHSSPVPDGIPNIRLKQGGNGLAKGLVHFFRFLLANETLPIEWKSADIIPIFKKALVQLAQIIARLASPALFTKSLNDFSKTVC